MYNSMSVLPFIPYRILSYLALKDEIIWKLLKYNTYDALSKPNLTFKEKMQLVWKEGKQDEYSIFMTNQIDDAIAEAKCIFKLYDYYIHAKESYIGTTVYAFDFLYGGQMALVDYKGIPVPRGDLFIGRVLKTLNGAEVGGVGTLVFDDNMSRYDLARSIIGNSKTFTGVQLFMSTNIGDIGEEEGCGS